jgi:DNA-binding Lrp family transcriptional regulator
MGLKSAPLVVRQTFEELRRSMGKPLSLHTISGGHYVYEYSSSRNKAGKAVIKTFYLGHITEQGRFIAKGQKELAGLEVREAGAQPAGEPYDEREAIVLRNLSMNGRMSMAKLAKRVGMSVTGTRHFVKRMEEKYQIRYFAEVNTLKLGFLRYIALVKFEDKVPTVKEIKEAFEDDPHVALVAMTKGIYDMIVIFYLENTANIANFVYQWRSTTALPSYTALWNITPLDMASGITIPLRKNIAELITSSADNSSIGLSKIENYVLKETMDSVKQDFKNIDKKYVLNSGRSNYAYYKLRDNGIIERATVTIVLPRLQYNAIFITETNNYRDFVANHDQRYMDIVNHDFLINKYVFRGDMGVPDSIFQICPIFDSFSFQKIKEELDSTQGTKTTSMIITDFVVGELCYRNFDPMYTTIYSTLIKHGKLLDKDKLSY